MNSRTLTRMSAVAWKARSHAHILGKTRVGAAARTRSGKIFGGCNVEHQFRCHDVHAEVNAISSMIAAGERELVAILVAAERERFTPCGGCMDWIMQFGSKDCRVFFQARPKGPLDTYTLDQLMPFYPR